jgi:hypothetical protein
MGGPSDSGNSLDRAAGTQYRRINSPIGVTGPTLVMVSFSSGDNMEPPRDFQEPAMAYFSDGRKLCIPFIQKIIALE